MTDPKAVDAVLAKHGIVQQEFNDGTWSPLPRGAIALATEIASLQSQLVEARGKAENGRPIHAVTWVVIREGHVLLERCPKKARVLGVGEWFVPGGKIEGDESSVSALIREVREEWPGCHVDRATPLPVLEGSPVDATPPKGTFLMRPFLVEITGEIPNESSEGIPLRWAPIEEALASPVPQVRMMVAAALSSGVAALTLDAQRWREREQKAQRRTDRWEMFADSAERETSNNGDNAFVRYVGPWVIAEYHRDSEDGDFLTPQTPSEYADALIASQQEKTNA